MADTPFMPVDDGVRVAIRVAPKSAANRIQGAARNATGGSLLKVAVTAPPEDGKANAALIALIAKTWRLPKRAVTIAAGATARRKLVHLAGDPKQLITQLEEWLKERHD
jgi:uncharacterized protein (TIGR00251 family)